MQGDLGAGSTPREATRSSSTAPGDSSTAPSRGRRTRARAREAPRRDALTAPDCSRSSSRARKFGRVDVLDAALAFAAAERAKPREASGPARPRLLGARDGRRAADRDPVVPRTLPRGAAGARRRLRVRGAGVRRRARCARSGELAGVDLAEAEVPGLRAVVADVRKLPFEDGAFDLALCISTLEHVGRDNEVYDVDAPRDDHGDETALRELRRVLRRTAACSSASRPASRDDQGWQLSATPERLDRACSSARASSSTRTSSTCAATRAGAPRSSPRRAAAPYRGRRRRGGAPSRAPPREPRREGASSRARRSASRRDPAQHPVP